MAKSYNQQFQVSDLYTNRGQLNFKLNFKNGKMISLTSTKERNVPFCQIIFKDLQTLVDVFNRKFP